MQIKFLTKKKLDPQTHGLPIRLTANPFDRYGGKFFPSPDWVKKLSHRWGIVSFFVGRIFPGENFCFPSYLGVGRNSPQ